MRIVSMLLDHVFMCIIIFLPTIPFFFLPMFQTSNELFVESDSFDQIQYVMLFGMALYICKDCFQGKSLAKRILKHQIVDSKTLTTASPIQCTIRNFTLLIWPIEVIVTFFNPEKRLGDRIAGTKVIPAQFGKSNAKVNWLHIVLSFLIATIYVYLWFLISKI